MQSIKICVIGLGYVGLPLAIEFGKKYETIGFDINEVRVDELSRGNDRTSEVTSEDINSSINLAFTHNCADIASANIYILSVPTPIKKNKSPDLIPIKNATELIARYLRPNDIVIYESTVYPGLTEEFCVPILENVSGLTFNHDFFCGYSPERINPGDKSRSIKDIVKVTSGSNARIATLVDNLYKSIIPAGTHLAPSIRVAEAAKVIENTQRDLNIALVNEFSLIFTKLGIDTNEVLEAAGTKWNFLKFQPGLVGGHCIGVDPYYLTHKAQEIGYHPEIILAGRRLNDQMANLVVTNLVKEMLKRRIHIYGSKILVMGITFKENCPDIRNTKIVDVIQELESYGCNVSCYDPIASDEEVDTSTA